MLRARSGKQLAASAVTAAERETARRGAQLPTPNEHPVQLRTRACLLNRRRSSFARPPDRRSRRDRRGRSARLPSPTSYSTADCATRQASGRNSPPDLTWSFPSSDLRAWCRSPKNRPIRSLAASDHKLSRDPGMSTLSPGTSTTRPSEPSPPPRRTSSFASSLSSSSRGGGSSHSATALSRQAARLGIVTNYKDLNLHSAAAKGNVGEFGFGRSQDVTGSNHLTLTHSPVPTQAWCSTRWRTANPSTRSSTASCRSTPPPRRGTRPSSACSSKPAPTSTVRACRAGSRAKGPSRAASRSEREVSRPANKRFRGSHPAQLTRE